VGEAPPAGRESGGGLQAVGDVVLTPDVAWLFLAALVMAGSAAFALLPSATGTTKGTPIPPSHPPRPRGEVCSEPPPALTEAAVRALRLLCLPPQASRGDVDRAAARIAWENDARYPPETADYVSNADFQRRVQRAREDVYAWRGWR